MDLLHAQIDSLQHELAFVAVDPIYWKFYVQAFSWGVALFESYLLLRQYPLYSETEPPAALVGHISSEDFVKSQQYGKDKAKFSLFSGLYKQCLDSAMLYYGIYAWSWDTAGKLVARFGYGAEYEITQSIVFSLVLFFIYYIQSLPPLVYKTFVLEEKHGLNKTTAAEFARRLLRSLAFAFALIPSFLVVFLYIFKWAGNRFVPWVMAFMISYQLVLVTTHSTYLYPLFTKLSPLPEGNLRTRIESLASKLKFPLKHLYEIDGSKPTSHSDVYYFGSPWSKHIVIFDTLIQQSKPGEVEALLANELGHWYHLHDTKMTAVSQFQNLIILATFPAFLHAPPLLQSFDFSKSITAQPPTIVAFYLFKLILTPLGVVVGIIMKAISRHFVWEADRFVCKLQDKFPDEEMKDMGGRLGQALITIHVKDLSTVWVDWLYSAYHNPQPTLTERLVALEAFQAQREKKKL